MTEINLTAVLRKAFPKTWEAILSMAFYYASTGRNAAYLFPSWAEDHETPIGDKISRMERSPSCSHR